MRKLTKSKLTKRKFLSFLSVLKIIEMLSWKVLAVVQMALIVVMAIVLVFSPADHSLQTLSAGSSLPSSMVHINVVFDGIALEKDIRELLIGLNASIVDGPSHTGLYVIAVSDNQLADQVIIQLESAEIITFVRKKI